MPGRVRDDFSADRGRDSKQLEELVQSIARLQVRSQLLPSVVKPLVRLTLVCHPSPSRNTKDQFAGVPIKYPSLRINTYWLSLMTKRLAANLC